MIADSSEKNYSLAHIADFPAKIDSPSTYIYDCRLSCKIDSLALI
jgi:hypothetical protein